MSDFDIDAFYAPCDMDPEELRLIGNVYHQDYQADLAAHQRPKTPSSIRPYIDMIWVDWNWDPQMIGRLEERLKDTR